MAKVSTYLKGPDRFPDLDYPRRLKEFSQQVNPKPGYVAEPPQEHLVSTWKVHISFEGVTYTSVQTGSYMDMVIARAIRSIPMGVVPKAGEPLLIEFEPAE